MPDNAWVAKDQRLDIVQRPRIEQNIKFLIIICYTCRPEHSPVAIREASSSNLLEQFHRSWPNIRQSLGDPL